MIRYASHYLFLPGHGFLRRYVVQMRDGRVEALFPLSDEIENTEWQPGVIALVECGTDVVDVSFAVKEVLAEVPAAVLARLPRLMPVLLFPFDFTRMEPVAGTRHRPLQ